MSVPMPPDLRIVPPGPDVDPALARFSGGWDNGAWGGILPTALGVERVGPDAAAAVVYAMGTCPQFMMEANWRRRSAKISDGTLCLDEARAAVRPVRRRLQVLDRGRPWAGAPASDLQWRLISSRHR